jgi:small subunit ribosomal protein S10e
MLVPKKNRLAVYSYLFREGVLVTRKELLMIKHGQLEVPQLHVVKLMQSLKSRGFVKERFSWQYGYFTLTDTGIEYLRNYLHLSPEVVPQTLKKPNKPQPQPSFQSQQAKAFNEDDARRQSNRSAGRGGSRGGRGGNRGGYRGAKEGGAPGNFNPEFSGSSGRGGGRGGAGGYRGGRGGSRGGYSNNNATSNNNTAAVTSTAASGTTQ